MSTRRSPAVDLFFRSLADTHGPHAAAIVLSGADADGAVGIKRIKERGGLTIAQDPEEAEYHGMPQSAIATGMVDWVLRVSEMPARLLDYIEHERRLQLPPEEGPQPAKAPRTTRDETEAALREVLGFLRARTGRDFSYYKRATIVRRIARRLQINGIEDLPGYLSFLRTHPGEAGALLQDLLISVTNFFRDREAFAAVETLIPELFRDKGPGDFVRVWSPACATGEEAYSLAMLLLEHARTLDSPPGIQVFGCDLDEGAIQMARAGIYPETIAADVSEERLRRFFVKEHRGYHVRREVREVVLFAAHDLLKDAPFSRMDLISCRNLLIYLNREAQKRALDIFHFALRPEGVLFLGTSESIEEGNTLFTVLDKKHRIYRHRPVQRAELPVPIGQGTLMRALEAQERAHAGPILPGKSFGRASEVAGALPAPAPHAGSAALGELHFRLLERLAPPSVIVNADHEIVHLSEHAGRFLELPGGEPTNNLLRVVHPMLRVELRSALFQAAESGSEIEVPRVAIETDGRRRAVNLRVAPARELAPGFLLVVFEPTDEEPGEPRKTPLAEPEPVVRQFEREIEVLKGRLRDTVEQYEASTEELKASNEELQAMNEELRSATEELETSREELQSINEELSTVNQELKSKLDELSHANSDLHNLMAATDIPTLFIDREGRIMRFTPCTAELFRIIPGDVGRPLSDLQHQLDYPELAEDIRRVLETLVPIGREIECARDRWFLARLLPYRTLEDKIAGVVLTFVEITSNKRNEEALRASEEQFRRAIEDAPIPMIMHAEDGQVLQISRTWTELTGYGPEDIPTFDAWLNRAYGHGADEVREHMHQLFRGEMRTMEVEIDIKTARGEVRHWSLSASAPGALRDGRRFIVGMALDITERKRAKEALRASEETLRLLIENVREYAILAMDLDRRITRWNTGAERLLGYSESEIGGQTADVIFTPGDRAADIPTKECATALKEGRANDEHWYLRKDGSLFWGSGSIMAVRNDVGETVGLVKILRDDTERREAAKTLERSQEELWKALQENERAREELQKAAEAKERFLAMLSHELRTPLTPVLIAAQVLQQRRDLPEEERDEALAMIRRNVEIEARFVDDLLDITRLSCGKLQILREPVDVHEVVQHAAEVIAGDLHAKELELSLSLDAARHKVRGDRMRLQQAVWNVLKNATKFSPHGGVIEVATRDAGESLLITVKDTGIGIEASDMERIFGAFAQGNVAITRRYGGLGLGLAIVQGIVEAHGGGVRVESDGKDKGATFTIELPLENDTSQPRRRESPRVSE